MVDLTNQLEFYMYTTLCVIYNGLHRTESVSFSVSSSDINKKFKFICVDDQISDCALLTYSNHTSTLDDPLIWGSLPLKELWDLPVKKQMRWSTLCNPMTIPQHLTST